MPRPNLFAPPARSSSIFIPGTLPVLPFLAPRVFAPWPKELGRRNLRSEPRLPLLRDRSQTARALERVSLEESNKLAAALGDLGFGDTDDHQQWKFSDDGRIDQPMVGLNTSRVTQGFVRRVASDQEATRGPACQTAENAVSWHLKDHFKRTYAATWGVIERKEFGQLATRNNLALSQLVTRRWARQRFTYLDRKHGLALERLRAIVKRRRNFEKNKRQRERKLLAAAGRGDLVQTYPSQRYISRPGTTSVSVISPQDQKLQELRRRLGEKKWAELRGSRSGKKHVLKRQKVSRFYFLW